MSHNESELLNDDNLWLNPAFSPVVISEDEIQFRAGPISGPRYTVRDEDEEGALKKLPPLLDGNRTVQEIVESFDTGQQNQIQEVLNELFRRDIIITSSEPIEEDLSISGYLSLTKLFSSSSKMSLADCSVVIIGDGAIGSDLASALIQLGVQNLTIANPHLSSDALSETGATLREEVPSKEELGEVDLVIFLADSPAHDMLSEINKAVHDVRTPLLIGQINDIDGFVGPAIIPGRSPCYRCFQRRLEANLSDQARYQHYRETSVPQEQDTVKSVFSALIESHTALHALHLLTTDTCLLTGSTVHINFLTMGFTRNDILRLPRCPVCGHDDSRRPEKQSFVTLEQLSDAGE